jgi:glycolate oxidase iron-sulfur subunit
MNEMFPLDELLREMNKCSGCGICLSFCPIYQASGIETISSRGRVDTIRGLLEGELKLTPRMEEILSTCLLCMACQTNCPPGVTSLKAILEARHRMVGQKGLPVLKRWAFHRLLRDRKALARAIRMAAMVQKISPSNENGPLRHLPTILSPVSGGRALPPLADKPLRDRINQRTPSLGRHVGSVAFFSGCYLEFVDTPMGKAGIDVLTSQGYEVIFPQGQVCCGAPVLYSGDLEDAVELALINARAFDGLEVESVVTLCATCCAALREGYKIISESLNGGERGLVLGLSRKVKDLSEFLTQSQGLRGPFLDLPLRVTYHDPCHHVRGLGIHSQPRELIQSIPGVELVEMRDPARCCGGGGSFSFTNPKLSIEIGRWKLNDVLDTGAQAVVTSCPGCVLQIQEVAQRQGASVEVIHVAELLARAIKNTAPPPREDV